MKTFYAICLFALLGNSFSHNIPDVIVELQNPSTTHIIVVLDKARIEDVNLLVQKMNNSQIKGLEVGHFGDDRLVIPIINILEYTNITSLYISNMGNDGASALVKVLKKTKITQLGLWDGKITHTGIEAVAQVLKDTAITELSIRLNNISNLGATAIAHCLGDTRITVLELIGSGISDDGAVDIANVLNNTRITELELSQNIISNRGAGAIANVLRDTLITKLNLEYNNISPGGAALLVDAVENTSISVHLWGNRVGRRQIITASNKNVD